MPIEAAPALSDVWDWVLSSRRLYLSITSGPIPPCSSLVLSGGPSVAPWDTVLFYMSFSFYIYYIFIYVRECIEQRTCSVRFCLRQPYFTAAGVNIPAAWQHALY